MFLSQAEWLVSGETEKSRVRAAEAELEAQRFCPPAEGGNGCHPRRATRARAGSYPCEKQAVAITQDAGDPPRGRAIGIPAGEITARRTGVPAGWGHGWGRSYSRVAMSLKTKLCVRL